MKLFSKPTLPMIYQAESTECALACLAMVCGWYGLDTTLPALRERYPVSLRGATLRDVVHLASQIGLSARPVRCEISNLRNLRKPALLHWDFEHFVVVKAYHPHHIVIHDPAAGVMTLSHDEVSKHFTGIALELTPTQDFLKAKVGDRLTLSGLARISRGLLPFVAQVIWLTAFLEGLALLSPLFLKTVIDSGLANEDFTFITALTLGFAGVALIHGVMSFARDYLIIYFGAHFNLQMMSSLFQHLLKLPMHYFEKRMTGDLIDRYQSTNAVRAVFTNGLPGILLDGLVSVISIGAVFWISDILGWISLGSFALYLLLCRLSFQPMHTLSEKAIKARSEENGHVIDTLRGIQPIKIFAKELERLHGWGNHYARLVNAEKKVGLLTAFQDATKLFILGLDLTLGIYFGALLVQQGTISLGLLFAFFVYKAHFTQRSFLFAERLMELRLVAIHLDRLADITFSDPEQIAGAGREVVRDGPLGSLAFRDVSFRYGPMDEWVLKDVNFTIREGEFVALTGPSGSGKTTLFKLMLGLHKPTSGTILYDDTPLDELDIHQYRKLFGVVMQQDQLLTGSILDNIVFFEASPDETRARACAEVAMIWHEIEQMPMKLNSRIGDLGSTLSGGQKQRILLARALYHHPRFMLMDEGTANLDQAVEEKLLDNLTQRDLTCISIAHRPETVKRASRVFRMEHARMVEITPEHAAMAVELEGVAS
ncbi:peptidase domain-containing ABC transporter [Acanthopleuribacter pedis]|uniref:Peptidase domain-containing ABC transporter n=1 Tax=Acanthopleuribacter pedis TaxID=442870 RepID=A0A8J7QKF0_9BACT|nr:peptidase domain-containing ABC transporter [Acanthopleuribacter pedis]MBO1319720.1 peptidase domain-containing ABC transporter [Acanthopleuribacter pedis]